LITYTAAQLNALLQDETHAKMLIELGSYYFCTGESALTYDSDLYEPRPMEFGSIVHGEHGASSALEVADEDATLIAANYSSRFAGTAMNWHFHLRGPDGGWAHIQTINWYVRYCQWDKKILKFNLFGNTGFKKRAGLSTMSRSCDLKFKGTLCGYAGSDKTCTGTLTDCTSKSNQNQFRGYRYAPEPGQVLESSGVRTHYQPPPPPGDDVADDAFGLTPWTSDSGVVITTGVTDTGRVVGNIRGVRRQGPGSTTTSTTDDGVTRRGKPR
jgi:hypothetical protein